MLQALQAFILSLITDGHKVLLMWDSDSFSSNSDITQFLQQCSLTNLLSNRGAIPPDASTSSWGRFIDFIHGTSLLISAICRGSGILSFYQSPHSNHHAIYDDLLDETVLFQPGKYHWPHFSQSTPFASTKSRTMYMLPTSRSSPWIYSFAPSFLLSCRSSKPACHHNCSFCFSMNFWILGFTRNE